jgi:hypothetical protein
VPNTNLHLRSHPLLPPLPLPPRIRPPRRRPQHHQIPLHPSLHYLHHYPRRIRALHFLDPRRRVAPPPRFILLAPRPRPRHFQQHHQTALARLRLDFQMGPGRVGLRLILRLWNRHRRVQYLQENADCNGLGPPISEPVCLARERSVDAQQLSQCEVMDRELVGQGQRHVLVALEFGGGGYVGWQFTAQFTGHGRCANSEPRATTCPGISVVGAHLGKTLIAADCATGLPGSAQAFAG